MKRPKVVKVVDLVVDHLHEAESPDPKCPGPARIERTRGDMFVIGCAGCPWKRQVTGLEMAAARAGGRAPHPFRRPVGLQERLADLETYTTV